MTGICACQEGRMGGWAQAWGKDPQEPTQMPGSNPNREWDKSLGGAGRCVWKMGGNTLTTEQAMTVRRIDEPVEHRHGG